MSGVPFLLDLQESFLWMCSGDLLDSKDQKYVNSWSFIQARLNTSLPLPLLLSYNVHRRQSLAVYLVPIIIPVSKYKQEVGWKCLIWSPSISYLTRMSELIVEFQGMQGLREWAWCTEYWTCESKSIHRQERKPWGEVMFKKPSWGKTGEDRSKPETKSGWSWPVAEKGTKIISVGVETGWIQRSEIGAGAEAGSL